METCIFLSGLIWTALSKYSSCLRWPHKEQIVNRISQNNEPYCIETWAASGDKGKSQ